MRLEALDEDGGGFEFWIDRAGRKEWHQSKVRTSAGSWTLGALEREQVLADFASKLKDDANASCVFVSSDPVKPFKSLTGKARTTDNETTFRAELNNEEDPALKKLREIWEADASKTYGLLRRCRVEIVSDDSLDDQLRAHCRLLFTEDPDTCVSRLKDHLEKRLTHTLTTDDLRSVVDELGLGWRARLDPTIDKQIEDATDHYLALQRPPIGGQRIETTEANEAVAALLDGPEKFIVLAGQAGSGKSSTVRSLIEAARERGHPVLAFRIDRLLTAKTLDELGEMVLGRKEDPAGVLGNRHPGKSTILIVDQVDAVSEASGRSNRARDLLMEMLKTAEFYGGMKVVLACRTYDLDHDANLKRLGENARSKTIRLAPLSWDQAVLPVLTGLGLPKRDYVEREKRLLSVPINLEIYSQIAKAGGSIARELSVSVLFDELLKIRAKEFRAAGITWTPVSALGSIAAYMSESQELTAPASVLQEFDGGVESLSSAGLITVAGNKLQFAHESFFDYAFSSAFVASQQSVLDLLKSAEQGLFRRTQVRQIFARLRDEGAERRYLQNLGDVMNSDEVRYLVKDAIGNWLNTIDQPTRKEAALVLPWLTDGHPLETIGRRILAGRNWFRVLAETGDIDRWLAEGGERKNFALWLMRLRASEESALVAETLRRRWDQSDASTTEILTWLNQLYIDGPLGDLEAFYFELIDRSPIEMFEEGKLPKSFELGAWAHKDKSLATRVLGRWLSRWLTLFSTGQPFGRDYSDNEFYWVKDAAEGDPVSFAEEIVPLLSKGIARDRDALAAGTTTYSDFRRFTFDDDEPREYLGVVHDALEKIAVEHTGRVEALLDQIPDDAPAGLYLHLETIAANGALLHQRLVSLLGNPLLLEADLDGTKWEPFARAAAAAMPHLSVEGRAKVEALVLSLHPELDRARRELAELRSFGGGQPMGADTRRYLARCLQFAGETQRAILTMIGRNQLTARALSRLDELDRKFPGRPLPVDERFRGGFVRSPIDSETAQKMSDENWLSAMKAYVDDSDHIHMRGYVIGGCRELAQVLRGVAKGQPKRFLDLLSRLPPDVSPAYADALISGLREAELSHEEADRVVEIAVERWPSEELDRDLCWFVQSHPTAARNPEVLARIMRVAENGSASDTAVRSSSNGKQERPTVRDMIGRGGDLDSSGLNSDRGAAYNALERVIWEAETCPDGLVEFARKRVKAEPLTSVRMQMLGFINSIAKHDEAAALDLLEELGQKDLLALNSRDGAHVLRWAVYNHAQRLRPLIDRLYASDVESLRALGLFLLSGPALRDDAVEADFRALWKTDLLARRVAAYRGTGNLTTEGAIGARAQQWIQTLLADADEDIFDDFMDWHWKELLSARPPKLDIARQFLASPIFEKKPDSLVRAISGMVDVHPELTMEVVRRVVGLLDTWKAEKPRGYHGATHGLGRLLVNLYRAVEGDASKEAEVLDLFDTYLARDMYDTREAIAEYERH